MFMRGVYHWYEDVYFIDDTTPWLEVDYWGIFLNEKETQPFNWVAAFRSKEAAELFITNPESTV